MTTVDSRNIARKVLFKNGYDVSDVVAMTEKERKSIFKKLDKELFGETKKEAIVNAKELIRIYSEESVDCETEEDTDDNEFSMIDFEF